MVNHQVSFFKTRVKKKCNRHVCSQTTNKQNALMTKGDKQSGKCKLYARNVVAFRGGKKIARRQ